MALITRYRYSLPSFPQFNEWKANIGLYNDERYLADVRFVENPESEFLQNIARVDPDGITLVYVHYSEFPLWLDTLRNEKPLYIHYYQRSKRILLSTSIEPIGEEES